MPSAELFLEGPVPDLLGHAVLDAGRCHFATERLGLVARMHGAGWYDRAGTDMFQLDRPVWADRLFAETGS